MSTATNTMNRSPHVAPRKRLTIHDIERENASNVFVYNRASKMNKVATQILIDHTHNGRTTIVEVVHTFIPTDLTWYIPKDQLLQNPSFMSLVARGYLELVASDEAEKLLLQPEYVAEQDRIRGAMERRFPEMTGELDMKSIPPNVGQLQNTLGEDANPADIGVSPPVVDALSRTDMSEPERVALIRNLADIMSEGDKNWVRQNTQDTQILAIVND